MRGTVQALFCVGLISFYAMCPAVAQQQSTIGNCSPAIINAQDVTITCPNGIDAAALKPSLDLINSMLATVQAKSQFVAKLLAANHTTEMNQLAAILNIAGEQLHQTVRLTYSLGFEDLPLTVALRWPGNVGAFEAYGHRVDALVRGKADQDGMSVEWPSIFPFSDVTWRNPQSEWFPQQSDGHEAVAFTRGTEINVRCYDTSTSDAVAGVTSVHQLDDLPVPLVNEYVKVDPLSCGVGFAVGDPEKNILIYGEKLASKPGSSHQSASFTSALDLFGGSCLVVVRNDGQSRATIPNMRNAWLLSMTMHFSSKVRYGISMNTNFTKIEGGDSWQLFRWRMPQKIADMDTWPVIGQFPPAPKCN
jgi:hypothetical protein